MFLQLLINKNSSDVIEVEITNEASTALNDGKYLVMKDVPNFLVFKILLEKLKIELKSVNNMVIHKQFSDASVELYTVILSFSKSTDSIMFYNRLNKRVLSAIKKVQYNLYFLKSVNGSIANEYLRTLSRYFDAENEIYNKIEQVEMNTCMVCLEPMDVNSSMISLYCQHHFHIHCLHNLESSNCPMCRFNHSDAQIKCMTCVSLHGSIGSPSTGNRDLWICLTCGVVNCGACSYHSSTSSIDIGSSSSSNADGNQNYNHSYEHYLTSQHEFAENIDDHRIWSFRANELVNRLILCEKVPSTFSNTEVSHSSSSSGNDGATKIVERGSGQQRQHEVLLSSKLDHVTRQYDSVLSYRLLQNALFYEDKIREVRGATNRMLRDHPHLLSSSNGNGSNFVAPAGSSLSYKRWTRALKESLQQERSKLRKQCEAIGTKIKTCATENEGLAVLNQHLASNQTDWRDRVAVAEESMGRSRRRTELELAALTATLEEKMKLVG